MAQTTQNTQRVRIDKRDYRKPRLRCLGNFHEMTRTTSNSNLIPANDLVTNTYYIS